MKLIDRYIGRQVLTSTVFAVVVLSVVLVLGNIIQRMMDLLVEAQIPISVILKLIGYILPFSLVFTMPWGFLTAILLVFGRLSADNELMSLRMTGLSITRICLPVFVLAAAFSGLCFWINVSVAPKAESAMQTLRYEAALQNPLSFFVPDQVTEVGDYRIYVEDKEGNELTNFQMVEVAGNRSKMFVAAKKVLVTSDPEKKEILLHLFDAQIKIDKDDDPEVGAPDNESIAFSDTYYSIHLEELAEKARRIRPSSLKTGKLLEMSRDEESHSLEDRTGFLVEVHKRFSFSLACVTFALIGIPLGVTAQRRETSIGFVLSLIVAAVYFMFIIVADWFKKNPDAYPQVLIWMPNLLFLGIGVWLFRRLSRR